MVQGSRGGEGACGFWTRSAPAFLIRACGEGVTGGEGKSEIMRIITIGFDLPAKGPPRLWTRPLVVVRLFPYAPRGISRLGGSRLPA